MTQGDSMDSWGCSPRSPSRGAVKTILPHCSGRLKTHLSLFYASLPRKALNKVLVNLSQHIQPPSKTAPTPRACSCPASRSQPLAHSWPSLWAGAAGPPGLTLSPTA